MLLQYQGNNGRLLSFRLPSSVSGTRQSINVDLGKNDEGKYLALVPNNRVINQNTKEKAFFFS